MNKKKMEVIPFQVSQVRMTIYSSLFAALIAFGSYATIPVGPVPICLQNFFVMIAAVLLGKRNGLLCISVYLIAGIIGLPVFAGGLSGIWRIVASPAGGYLMAYIPATYVMAAITEDFPPLVIRDLFALILGTLIIYIGGIIFLKFFLGLTSWHKALAIGFFPFILFDAIKIAVVIPVIIFLRQIMYPDMPKTGIFTSIKKT